MDNILSSGRVGVSPFLSHVLFTLQLAEIAETAIFSVSLVAKFHIVDIFSVCRITPPCELERLGLATGVQVGLGAPVWAVRWESFLLSTVVIACSANDRGRPELADQNH